MPIFYGYTCQKYNGRLIVHNECCLKQVIKRSERECWNSNGGHWIGDLDPASSVSPSAASFLSGTATVVAAPIPPDPGSIAALTTDAVHLPAVSTRPPIMWCPPTGLPDPNKILWRHNISLNKRICRGQAPSAAGRDGRDIISYLFGLPGQAAS